ncbi:TPA: cobalt ABC transporter ATP-binding protein [bacterium]|nr:cobalt ABC transporter ATP-binding protein [bacterium]
MTRKAIEVKELNFSYPDGRKALVDINLDVYEGEALGVIGPNGAGKSTFLLHLNGILRGNSKIKILGIEMENKSLPQIRSRAGLLFQDSENQLFMPTVFEDVAFGPLNMDLSKDEVEVVVKEALKEVDMLDYIYHHPHHLSFGEKRRIALATVLAMKPKILLLDEPTSNVDPKHRRDLINFLKELDNLTKVIATHDLELVFEVCSRVALLDQGRLITSGNPLEILKDKTLLAAHSLEVPRWLSS